MMSLRKSMAALASVVLLSAVMVGAPESPASASACLTIDSNNVVTDGKTCTGAVVVPESVRGIGELAFDGSGLVSITIPASVTSIGSNAFVRAASLESVTFAGGSQLSSIGEYAFSRSGLRSIIIPASVTSIGTSAFEDTIALAAVTFAGVSQLSSIGADSFFQSALTSITIPASVTSIGDSAFRNAIDLTSVTFAGNAPTIGGSSVFTNVANGAVANVGFAATGFEPDVSGLWEGLVLVKAAAPSGSTATPGLGGIFLHIAGGPGRSVPDTPVHYGSVGVAPNTSFTLSVQRMGARALTRTVLASGVTNGGGHVEGRIQLSALAPGSYKIVMTGTHRLGHSLVLTNHIRVDAGGKFVSVSPESLQPSLK